MILYKLLDIKEILNSCENYDGLDFAYAVVKNKQLVEDKLKEVDFIKNVSPQIIEYENKRIELCETFAKKDSDGNPIIDDGLYILNENKDEFDNLMTDLINNYKYYIDERQKQIDLFNQKMNEDIELSFFKIKKEQIPSEITTSKELDKISFMLE